MDDDDPKMTDNAGRSVGKIIIYSMERLYMEAQDGLKTIQGEYREAHLFSQLLLYYYLVVSLTLQKTALW